jgi:3-hydroxyacyl-CoA dehydrogenase / enoyl-CoA hydratase / 3-hydroxybutyryl-CoA epimerase
MTRTLRYELDCAGIAVITLDDPERSVNVVSPAFISDLTDAIEKIAADPAVIGAIITSAKTSFMAGADLHHILSMMSAERPVDAAMALSERASIAMHRRLETCGKPFVALINGYALGGGYELCLACHQRIMTDDPKATVGLPEVTVGLLPGSGGTQRLPRMIGLEASVPILLEGRTLNPQAALEIGMVDRVVPAVQLLAAAREWLLGRPDSVRAWDRKGYKPANGLLNGATALTLSTRATAIAAQTQHNYPAPITILRCLFEGTMLPFDRALRLESKYFAQLFAHPVTRNIIRTGFVNKAEAAKLARRPKGFPQRPVRRLGVLGAGMMGAGIASVAADAGIDVVLLDRSVGEADKGKARYATVLDKEVQRGRRTRERADQVLARIQTSAEYSSLAGCDLVVEAVFEDVGIKAQVTRAAEAVIASESVLASNTSTLPITELAAACNRPERFIGLHFFSPVDRMPIVEVIVGRKTDAATLAAALDFVGQLRMTPILVRDSRGFYTSRVFQTFIHEGMALLAGGVAPALIENAARLAGFPVGPLALLDEVTLELPLKIVVENRALAGKSYVEPCGYPVLKRMVEELGRPGKRHGKGFYEYPADRRKHLWPGLADAFPVAQTQPSVEQIKSRLLSIQALETARCLEEGVLTDPADGDVGSVLAWGFPSWTGGTLSYIDTVGIGRFVAECERFAEQFGPRFAPSQWLRQRAARGESFYPA